MWALLIIPDVSTFSLGTLGIRSRTRREECRGGGCPGWWMRGVSPEVFIRVGVCRVICIIVEMFEENVRLFIT